MKKFKDLLTVLEVDKIIWGDKLIAPPMFDAFALLFVMILGAVSGGATMMSSIWNTGYEMPAAIVWMSVTIVYLYLVSESVFGGLTWKVCVLRPLLMAAEVLVAYFLGYLLSAIIVVIVSIVLTIIFLGLVLKIILGTAFDSMQNSGSSYSGSSSGPTEKKPDFILQDGIKEIKLYESGVDYKGDDGHYYEKNVDGSFSRK